MNKIIRSLLVLLMVFILTGCELNISINNNNQESAKEEEKQEGKKETKNNEERDVIVDDDEDNKPEEPKTIESKLINCTKCVFAYFTDNKTFGDKLTDYTKDYSTLKNRKGEQLRRFLGFILDSNDNIKRAFACGIKDGKAFCIEGATDDHTYQYNIGILNKVFSASECRYIANGKTYVCTDGNTNADTRADGNVSVHYDENCHIFGDTARIACY